PSSPPSPAPSRSPDPASSPSPTPTRTPDPASSPAPDPTRPARTPQPARSRPAQTARAPARPARATPAVETVSSVRLQKPASGPARRPATGRAAGPSRKYQQPMPASVKNAFVALAKVPIIRAEPLYRDVASNSGIRWELLAACDWMECESRPRY